MWSARHQVDRPAVAGLTLPVALLLAGQIAPAAGQEAGHAGESAVAPRVVQVQAGPQSRAGFLGVQIREVDRETVQRLDLPRERGVLVESVVDGSPAEEAGLREADVITAWDGEEVAGTLELQRLVRETPPGRRVAVTLVRGGERQEVTLTVGERPGPGARAGARVYTVPPGRHDLRLRRLSPHRWEEMADSMRALRGDSALGEEYRERMRQRMEEMREQMEIRPHAFRRLPGGGGHMYFFDSRRPARLGVRLQELTPQLADYFGLEDGKGALVASVREDSPARDAGLRAGDVIVSVDGEPVEDPGDVARAVRRREAGPVEIRIVRDGRERALTVELESPRESSLDLDVLPGDLTLEPPVVELEPMLPDLDGASMGLGPVLEDLELGPALRELERALEEIDPALEEIGPALEEALEGVPLPPPAPVLPREPAPGVVDGGDGDIPPPAHPPTVVRPVVS